MLSEYSIYYINKISNLKIMYLALINVFDMMLFLKPLLIKILRGSIYLLQLYMLNSSVKVKT